MIKGKGVIRKVAGHADMSEFVKSCENLSDNRDYLYVICDDTKNRNLPYISYFFSVVLSYLSGALPDHPSTRALYKYFEDMFAPVHIAEINGKRFEYRELKSERVRDINDVIEKVVKYALDKWNIDIPRKEDLKSPELRELYSQAYLNQEVDWSNFISSHNITRNERRNQKNECVSGIHTDSADIC